MALPTMPAYWTQRYKNIQERNMVSRRQNEADFRDKWDNNAKYFQKRGVEAVKQSGWMSERSFQSSMDTYRSRNASEEKAQKLQARRERLKILLQDEKDELEAELRGLSTGNYMRLSDMKDRTNEIKSKRERERQQIADEKMYEHWKKNNPDLRKLESNMHKKHVIQRWGEQIQETTDRRTTAREQERKDDYRLEMERLAAIEKDHQAQEARLQEEKIRASELKEQMMELKQREFEAEKLKNEEAALMQEQWELEKLEEERYKLEEQRKQTQLGQFLSRQYKAQLRRKSQEVQKALEMDRKILEALAEKEEEDKGLQSARREKAQADAAWMRQVVDEQIQLEKAREAELDMLYREEAQRQWNKREAEWERERLARERLMSEVLAGRLTQVKSKIEENQRRQEESLQQREDLLRELEVAQQMTARDKAATARQKQQTHREIQDQISEKNERVQKAIRRELQEKQMEEEAERGYEEMLRQEASRMSLHGYEPQSHPRTRRSAWD
ncbi:trichoplein keratin filament-binding protein-like [Anneissia japonica]|uniref:trichoplein keratin filament-binding protein-like n=1 Tax=Anneissia japonica TaxID=1529436 RepID=UPI001425AB48|nr:trichoplein keratin filament-binding protein-like [Anneissia japonica]